MQCNNHINIFEILYMSKDKLGFTLKFLYTFVIRYFSKTYTIIVYNIKKYYCIL